MGKECNWFKLSHKSKLAGLNWEGDSIINATFFLVVVIVVVVVVPARTHRTERDAARNLPRPGACTVLPRAAEDHPVPHRAGRHQLRTAPLSCIVTIAVVVVVVAVVRTTAKTVQ